MHSKHQHQWRPSIDKAALDKAADIFLYAPAGLLLRLRDDLPDLIRTGRDQLETPITAAKMMGQVFINQSRKSAEQRFGPRRTSGGPRSEQPAPSSARATTHRASNAKRAAAVPTAEDLAITRYDSLAATQVIAHLEALSIDELQAIAAYERANRHRKTILTRVEHLLAQAG